MTSDSGIDFKHVSGMTEAKHLPTANGSGVAVFDYDQDGKMDLYFANGCPLPLGSKPSAPNRLYRNLGQGRFKDETASSGLGFTGYCHGIIVGDIDNDGDQDVYLCNYGADALYLNNANGTFREIGQDAGIAQPGWSSSGAFLDFDHDGDLDLYVARYGDWRLPEDDLYCGEPARHIRLYCMPKEIRYSRHILYRNNGNLTFTDVTEAAGVARTDGHGFGVVAADLDGDVRTDLYVANDQDPNFLFLNRGDGTFQDVTLTSAAAGDEHGQYQGSMGVDADDVDGDGLPELLVTNFEQEGCTLYQNLGGSLFMDATAAYGLRIDTLPWVGWGCALADLDNDGRVDVFMANGHIDDNRRLLGQDAPYSQPPLLFRNIGGQRFVRATRGAGGYFAGKHVGHGVAVGDLDDDGDLDLVISHKDAAPAVLRNDTPSGYHWIRLELTGHRSNRDAVGARVELLADGVSMVRQRKGGCSLMSSHDPRLLIGLGSAREVQRLTIRWPSGAITKLENLAVDRTHKLDEPLPGPSKSKVP